MQRVTASGDIAPGWPPDGFPVCTDPASQGTSIWSVVPDGLGGVLVGWHDYRNVVPGGTSVDIYAQRILAEGTLAPGWPVNGAPVSRAPGIQSFPVVAADGTGGAFVSWQVDAMDDVYLQRLTASGEVGPGWPANGLPIAVLPGFQGGSQLAPDDAGGVLIAWGEVRDGLLAAYAQRVTAAGQIDPGWPENGVRVVPDRAIRELIPDGEGGAYLSCATLGFLDSLYFVQRFTGAGSIAPGWPEGGAPVCLAPRERAGIRMVPDGAGGVLLAWYDYRDIYDDEIFVQRVRPDGTLYPGWPRDGLQVTDNTAFDSGPDLAPDGLGGAYVCWDRESGPFVSDDRVLVQRVTGAGTVAPGWPENGLQIPSDQQMLSPRITADGQGGAIVAWEHGCCGLRALRFGPDGPTPVQLALVSAEATPDRVRLTWHGPQAAGLQATVYRRTEGTDWQRLGSVVADGSGRLRYDDRDVVPGGRYAYRLGYDASGVEAFTAEVWLDIPTGLTLALQGLRPNPAVGELVASFTLPAAEPAPLELLDLTGRRVLLREVGSLGAGRHLLRLSDGTDVPAGIYWLRLRQGGQSLVARGVVVR